MRRETAKEIASALAYLHSLNILHGDLSGGNILLTSSNKDPRKFTCKVSMEDICRPVPLLVCAHISVWYPSLVWEMPLLHHSDQDQGMPKTVRDQGMPKTVRAHYYRDVLADEGRSQPALHQVACCIVSAVQALSAF